MPYLHGRRCRIIRFPRAYFGRQTFIKRPCLFPRVALLFSVRAASNSVRSLIIRAIVTTRTNKLAPNSGSVYESFIQNIITSFLAFETVETMTIVMIEMFVTVVMIVTIKMFVTTMMTVIFVIITNPSITLFP